MGQRSQVILITPEVYINDENPNNHKGQVWVSHNQWRYGVNAIIVLADILRWFQHNINIQDRVDRDWFYKSELGRTKLQLAQRYAENRNIDNEMSQSHTPENLSKELVSSKSINDFLDNCMDNNNGYFIIRINEDLRITYDIITGLEDTNEHKSVDAIEYVSTFIEKKIPHEAIKELSKHSRCNGFEELEKLKKKLSGEANANS